MPTVPALTIDNRTSNTISGNVLVSQLINAPVGVLADDYLQPVATFSANFNFFSSGGLTQTATLSAPTGSSQVWVAGTLAYPDGNPAPNAWPIGEDAWFHTGFTGDLTPGGKIIGISDATQYVYKTLTGTPAVINGGSEVTITFKWKKVVTWLCPPQTYANSIGVPIPPPPPYSAFTIFHAGNSSGVDIQYSAGVIPAVVTAAPAPALTAPLNVIPIVTGIDKTNTPWLITLRYMALQGFDCEATITLPIDAAPAQMRLTNDYGEFSPWSSLTWQAYQPASLVRDHSGYLLAAASGGITSNNTGGSLWTNLSSMPAGASFGSIVQQPSGLICLMARSAAASMFWVSRNFGETFINMAATPFDTTYGIALMTGGARGVLYACAPKKGTVPLEVWFITSRDDGATWTAPVYVGDAGTSRTLCSCVERESGQLLVTNGNDKNWTSNQGGAAGSWVAVP